MFTCESFECMRQGGGGPCTIYASILSLHSRLCSVTAHEQWWQRLRFCICKKVVICNMYPHHTTQPDVRMCIHMRFKDALKWSKCFWKFFGQKTKIYGYLNGSNLRSIILIWCVGYDWYQFYTIIFWSNKWCD